MSGISSYQPLPEPSNYVRLNPADVQRFQEAIASTKVQEIAQKSFKNRIDTIQVDLGNKQYIYLSRSDYLKVREEYNYNLPEFSSLSKEASQSIEESKGTEESGSSEVLPEFVDVEADAGWDEPPEDDTSDLKKGVGEVKGWEDVKGKGIFTDEDIDIPSKQNNS